MSDDPAPSPATPARRFGAPRQASVPRMETVRVTAPDLLRRAAMERTRGRLVLAAAGFAALFGAVSLKLADATILRPVQPRVASHRVAPRPAATAQGPDGAPRVIRAAALGRAGADDPPAVAEPSDDGLAAPDGRATITDRNGEILAISLPTAGLYANPREMTDAADAAHKLKAALPSLDEAVVRARLSDPAKQFVYLARQLTPRQQLAINDLGIPGISFQATERRRYPEGRVAAQVLGGVDVDGHGVAGVERSFDARLAQGGEPLRLSLDIRVQAVVRDELARAMAEFQAIGACGIVMDVRTGEVIAMVSLPDYDANEFGRSAPVDRFNRAVTGVYEPGSTFKLQTVSMALDAGVVNLSSGFDASSPIHIGRFTINDFKGKGRWLSVPEIIAYSSNIGAAKMGQAVGTERQRAWLAKVGMMSRSGVELPEVGRPLFPPVANWKEAATLTIAFGQGLAVSPLQVVTGTAAVANGGLLQRPTVLALDDGARPEGTRIMKQATSDTVRRLMRLVVTDGYGKAADVPGYFVGGKTGTAQKTGGGRGYAVDKRISAFMSVFPMNAPRYAVYMMLDEPKGNAETGGYATAGLVSAPAAGRVIARIGPMLGLLPDVEHAAEIQATLAIPLGSGRSAAVKAGVAKAAPTRPAPAVPNTVSAPVLPPPVPAARDLRHQAMWSTPADGATTLAHE